VAGQTGVEQARADMRELVETARQRGAVALFVWGGVAVAAFTAAFASWQYAPARPIAGDAGIATASLPASATAPAARQVGVGRITAVPGVSDLGLVQRDLADLRQDFNDLKRGLTRYDIANEQLARRLEGVEDQTAILASRWAQALETARSAAPVSPSPAPQANAAPAPAAKPVPHTLEPGLFDTRVGKVAARPIVPDEPEAKPMPKPEKPRESEAAKDTKTAAAPAPKEPVKEPAAEPAKPTSAEAPKPALEPPKPAAETAKPVPAVAVAPMPAPPAPTPAPAAAAARPAPTPAEEAQRAQRALQAAQVQQLAQQMILGQPGAKGLQVPLPAQSQLAAAAAAAKQEARPETTGSVGAADTVAKTQFAVDLGGYKSLSALKKGWTATAARHGALTRGLVPLGQMKEAGNAMEARLIAGPFANALDAAKFCAQVKPAGTACAPSVYVGQPLPQ
jgi:hypothetical protein